MTLAKTGGLSCWAIYHRLSAHYKACARWFLLQPATLRFDPKWQFIMWRFGHAADMKRSRSSILLVRHPKET